MFKIDEWQVSWMFYPIRKKVDVIKLLMETIKVMLIGNNYLSDDLVKGKVVLYVSKMSRLFYFSSSRDKYFSIKFPFFVNDEKGLSFYSKTVGDIDSRITSDVISVISSDNFLDADDIYEFLDPIENIDDYNAGFWSFLKELFLFEDGYIRYEYDKEYENGKIHPLNHLDIFYSSGSTFKIGLWDILAEDSLIDLVNIESDCHFLEKCKLIL